MLFKWIKGFVESRNSDGSFYYRLNRERYKADLNYSDRSFTNLEFRGF